MDTENLTKLANYLESGELKAGFNMAYYSLSGDEQPATYELDCGSVGCAVGHGPYAGIPKRVGENWVTYADRVFGLTKQEHNYCFHALWVRYDNTPVGAAKRIRHVLAGGDIRLPWTDFHGQN